MIGSTEIMIIALVILVLFGSAALPKFARSLGKAKKEFKEGLQETEDESADNKNDNKTEK